MLIRLLLFASFRETTGRREMHLDVPPGNTAGDVLARLVDAYPGLRPLASVSRCVVNQEYVPEHTVLQAGDELSFIPPVSGGDHFEVVDAPLQVEPAVTAVTDDTVGGVATFVGVVRGFSKGKPISYLEYEAYRPMAEKSMAEIGAEMHRRWPIHAVAIRHRVGRLEIGEVAIVIAVGAPHRAEAFAACQYAIDEIKKSVPVWKKEVWQDGEVWVGVEGA